jgi:hypothetical protein
MASIGLDFFGILSGMVIGQNKKGCSNISLVPIATFFVVGVELWEWGCAEPFWAGNQHAT